MWYKHGKLDRANGPANIMRDPDTGKTVFEAWYKDGVLSRPDDRPCFLIYGDNGKPIESDTFYYGTLLSVKK